MARRSAIAAAPFRAASWTRVVSEAAFLDQVRDLAQLRGWATYHTHNSLHSEPGFPDLVLVSARQHRTIFAELKKQNGVVSGSQRIWLNALAAAGNEVALWRPSDMEEIQRVLCGQRLAGNPLEAS